MHPTYPTKRAYVEAAQLADEFVIERLDWSIPFPSQQRRDAARARRAR